MLTITYGFTGSISKTITIAETTSATTQSTAIQAALDSVADHIGAFVTLSAGTFAVQGTGKASDGALRVGSDTTFGGAGLGATTIKLADGSGTLTGIVRTDSGGTNPDGSPKTCHDVTIQNLSIDGNKAATTGDVDGFYCGPKPNTAAFDSNITVDHVEVMNVSRYGFDPHEQTKGLTFSNSIAHNNGADGFTIDFATDVSLVNNQSYDNGRHGFNVVTSSSNVHFLNNDAFGNGQSGIVVQTGDNEIRSLTHAISILGGNIHDNGRAGIEVRQAADVSIAGTWISGNKAEAIILSGVDGANLSHNTLLANGSGLSANAPAIRVEGMLQDFGDSDPANDRWIATHKVTIDGVLQADPAIPSGVTVYSYAVTGSADTIFGSNGRDAIAAGSGADKIYGNSGNDTLFGEDGNDWLYGGTGSDTLFGNDGNDILNGGAGSDMLSGGRGKDTFAFDNHWGSDTVADFRHGTDKLDLRPVSGLTTFSQLSISKIGTDTKVGFGGDYILLKNIAPAAIDHTDFLL